MSEPRHPLGYLPGIDGLRAVAVSAVFLFHAGVLDGGFIGVDVFFVISGFLITALALAEIERDGHLRLGAFWARRARRSRFLSASACDVWPRSVSSIIDIGALSPWRLPILTILV